MTKERREQMIIDICVSVKTELEDTQCLTEEAKAELIAKESIVDCFNDGEVFEFISDPVVEYLWRLEKPLEWLYNRMCADNYKNTEDFLVRTTQDIAFAM